MIRLRSSGIDCWHGCPAKYDIKYNKGYETVDDNFILTFGQGAHSALECRGKGGDLKAQRAAWSKEASILPWNQRVIGESIIILYNAAYADEGITYKHVEYAFSIEMSCEPYLHQLPDGTIESRRSYVFSGKFDGLCIDSNGDWFIMEHKTTRGDITDDSLYWRRREMNTQADLYLWAARKLGFDVKYILYDVLKVPQLRPYKATPKAKQEFYKRGSKDGTKKPGDPKPTTRLRSEGTDEFKARVGEYILKNAESMLKRKKIERTDKELDRAAKNLDNVSKLVRTGIFPTNPNNCFAYNDECEFRPVCLGETNLDNAGLYRINEDPLGY